MPEKYFRGDAISVVDRFYLVQVVAGIKTAYSIELHRSVQIIGHRN